MEQFLQTTYWNNTVSEYIQFGIILLAGFLGAKLIGHYLVKFLNTMTEKTNTTVDDFVVTSIRKNLMPILYFVVFYFAVKTLNLNPALSGIVNILLLALMIILSTMMISSVVLFFLDKYMESRINGANSVIAIKWTNGIVKVLIWCIALILFLDNIGVKITSLVTGLGIGGVAVAFAAQAILVDVFCCFTIFFDKPFEIGDFIIAGEQMGTVEHIGMKTTRLRALDGEQLILANSDLTNSRISNYKTMEERRVVFRIGVTYDTSYDKLKEIPGLIRELIDQVPGTRFGRTHFCAYGPYSLDFEIAYYVLSSDYDKYLDLNQEIYYRIKAEFDSRAIEFAFPTQTLQVFNSSLK